MEKDILICGYNKKEIWYSYSNGIPYTCFSDNPHEELYINNEYQHQYYYKSEISGDIFKVIAKVGGFVITLDNGEIYLRSSKRIKIDMMYTNLTLIENIKDE